MLVSSIAFFHLNSCHCIALQMRKYCSNKDDSIIGTLPPTSGVTQTSTPQFLQYMKDFDDEDVEGDTSVTEKTIDEEFNNYVSSVPKRNAALDTLRFWEVSTCDCQSN
jgi:hAT family C-terminal dimerisation region